jgi:hypothetical protein
VIDAEEQIEPVTLGSGASEELYLRSRIYGASGVKHVKKRGCHRLPKSAITSTHQCR